jgi:hypothetical protein
MRLLRASDSTKKFWVYDAANGVMRPYGAGSDPDVISFQFPSLKEARLCENIQRLAQAGRESGQRFGGGTAKGMQTAHVRAEPAPENHGCTMEPLGQAVPAKGESFPSLYGGRVPPAQRGGHVAIDFHDALSVFLVEQDSVDEPGHIPVAFSRNLDGAGVQAVQTGEYALLIPLAVAQVQGPEQRGRFQLDLSGIALCQAGLFRTMDQDIQIPLVKDFAGEEKMLSLCQGYQRIVFYEI